MSKLKSSRDCLRQNKSNWTLRKCHYNSIESPNLHLHTKFEKIEYSCTTRYLLIVKRITPIFVFSLIANFQVFSAIDFNREVRPLLASKC